MLKKSDLISFIAASSTAEARRFYEETLGLPFVDEDQFAVVFEANGTMLRMQKVDHVNPHEYTVLGWKVSNIRKEVATLEARGVQFVRYEGMFQDEYGIWTAPGSAQVAWFKDPDGNILSLTEFPK
jgi:catechol 2,3-dioxygenase-like lactoylglutathione lyase family enzyme